MRDKGGNLRLSAGISLLLGAVLAGSAGSAATATPPPTLRPGGIPVVGNLKVLSGSMHDHTTDSDGDTASCIVAKWLFDHHAELGTDFEILSEHSDSFPAGGPPPPSPCNSKVVPWTRQAKLDAQYTRDGFSMMRGFEITNDLEDHFNVLGSSYYTTRFIMQEPAMTMLPLWKWLAAPAIGDPVTGLGAGGSDGVGQFNHPADKGALNFDDYTFNKKASPFVSTIEIHGQYDRTGLSRSDAGWYWFALQRGWTVGPVMDWDFHHWTGDRIILQPQPGSDCGLAPYMFCQRSLVVATTNTPAGLMEALKARRTAATERADLWATLRGPGGAWMGSTVGGRAGDQVTLTVDAGATNSNLTWVDIVSDNGVSPYPYYYGDNPQANWPQNQMLPSFVEQHRRFVTSGGHATRKGEIDGPPSGTLVASVPLSGHRATQTITVTVPSSPSSRPDGKHFFYAIVHTMVLPTDAGSFADGLSTVGDWRTWTAPILVGAA